MSKTHDYGDGKRGRLLFFPGGEVPKGANVRTSGFYYDFLRGYASKT
jgi:hypothetical protein